MRPEIAGELHASLNTVSTHVRTLYLKLGAHNRREAVDRAGGDSRANLTVTAVRLAGPRQRFVNSRLGRQLRLRGMNARVVMPGIVRPGDLATKASISHRELAPDTAGQL